MSPEKIKEVLDAHQKWLNDEEGGVHADLRHADLSGAGLRYANLRGAGLRCADLSHADLRGADLRHADLSGADLRGANLSGASLSGADLRNADLRNANLRNANLRDANLDFSCFPLWCGGSRFKCYEKLVRQLFAHIMTLEVEDESDEMKAARAAIRGEALKSHRAKDLGLEE